MNPIPKLTQLSRVVWRILGCNPGPMTLQGTNVYLVGSGANRILIDAGQDGFPEYVENLSGLLSQENVTVDKIIVTHWHKDHIGALEELRSSIFKKMGVKPMVWKFQRQDVPDQPLPEGYSLQTLTDNQVFSANDATLRVLFTPGHTTDHAALFLEEEKAVFSGDCILGEGTAVFEDLHDYMLSLKRIMDSNPSLIYPAHGPVIKDPLERIAYYLSHRMEREAQILQALGQAETLSPMEIVKIVYKATPVHLHSAAEVNVSHHLDKLFKEKRVRKKNDRFSIAPDESS